MEVQINYALKLKVCKTILHIKFFFLFRRENRHFENRSAQASCNVEINRGLLQLVFESPNNKIYMYVC